MPNLTTLRRRAARRGLRLSKVPESSRWRLQYGPFMLIDADTSAVVARCLDLDDLAVHLP